MSKIRINLTLEFSLPEEKLTVNGLLAGVRKVIGQIFFIIVKTLFAAIEEREMKRLKTEEPGRFVKNGHQKRLLRTSFGKDSFHSQPPPVSERSDGAGRRSGGPCFLPAERFRERTDNNRQGGQGHFSLLTGVRLQGYKGKDLGGKQMRWALACQGEKKPFEIVGFWVESLTPKDLPRIKELAQKAKTQF